MVLYSRARRQRERGKLRPCAVRYGELCFACKEDIQLERNIQDSEVQGRGRTLRTQMNANHDPFLLKLPPEIASHIFYLSVEEQRCDPGHDTLKKLPMQFLLGTICRGWRQLARSTPELWSTLSFTLTKPMKAEGVPVVQVITDWLLLSGNLPLTLRVFDVENWDPRETHPTASCSTCEVIIDALNQHSGRWKEVFLHIPSYFVHYFHGTSCPIRLCDLRIKRQLNWAYKGVAPIFRMSSRPSPAHVFISSPYLSIDILWNNLRDLEIDNMLGTCIEVIREAPLLECLFCHWSILPLADIPAFLFPNIIIRHMRLRKLGFFGFPTDLLVRFLNILELPSLEDYCHITKGHGNIVVDEVTSLINRSGSHLKYLEIRLRCMRSTQVGDLKKLLNALPDLRTLKVEIYYSPFRSLVISDLLETLSSSPPTLAGGIPGFLPHLQYLNLSFIDGAGSIWGNIPQIYSWPHRKILSREVNANIDLGIEVDVLAKILRLIDQGLDICILHDGENYLRRFNQARRFTCTRLGLRLKQKLELKRMRIKGK
ncbi:hypothetical protein M413DRAFT_31329 [Hebeloma cylindrosporum]|uniref:Uncharacterized protein n=1 Tax=Hebeloma cylindrosporum TaxID=76867 RepID=A0A0C3BJM9_HEBCY|nr:hypothetical protein M413DRAFT_31329 [Hebeloma cylindrosporum h7]